jgi:hypothetical protein
MDNPFLNPKDWSLEVLGGVFTSIVFWLWFQLFKPRIAISKKICVRNQKDKAKYFQIKVVNKSFWKLVDVRFSLLLVTPTGSPGGKSTSMIEVECVPRQLIEIPPHPVSLFWGTIKRNYDEYAPHAFLVTIREDIKTLWTDKSGHLEFRVHAKHGYSGRTVVIKEPYTDCETVFKKR